MDATHPVKYKVSILHNAPLGKKCGMLRGPQPAADVKLYSAGTSSKTHMARPELQWETGVGFRNVRCAATWAVDALLLCPLRNVERNTI